MRCLCSLCASAALLCCLAASPARADMAGTDADDAGASAGPLLARLQEVTHLLEESAIVPESSLTVSQTKSAGPSTVPPTSKGVDRTGASPVTLPVGAEFHTGARVFERASQTFSQADPLTDPQNVSGDPVPAAAPPLQPRGELNRYVGDPPVPSADVTTMAASSSTPLNLGASLQDIATPTVPIPAAAFLLGGGLLVVLPLRRSARFSLRA